MCLSPRTIVNPTKYVSLKYPDQMLLQVPCCKCAECQQTLSNQWFYRAWYEFADCMQSRDAFVQFDTLTYRNRDLPHISDFVDVPKHLDFSCFSPRDYRQFITNLNTQCKRRYPGVSFRYFLASEYGSVDKTFRPHYHVLFFVYGGIDPLDWSRLVAEVWRYGRTDGVPYRSANYVMNHNTVRTNNVGHQLRVTNYVIKYVQKNCPYQDKLNRRLGAVMDYISRISAVVPDFEDTLTYKLVRESIVRNINQFHRQSQHFGESILRDIDLDNVMKTGVIYMPHNRFVKLPVVLPMYLKRKLFYEMVEVDGVKAWQLNDLGCQFREIRREMNTELLVNRYKCLCLEHNLSIDCERLAKYSLYKRGRIIADNFESTLEERYRDCSLFGYVTRYDKEKLRQRGYSNRFVGNSVLGYSSPVLPRVYSISEFIRRYVYLDDDLESELSLLMSKSKIHGLKRQSAYAHKQRLSMLFSST